MSESPVILKDVLAKSDSGVWASDAPSGGISILRSTNFTRDGEISFANLAIKDVDKRDRDRKILEPGDILLEKSGGGPQQPVGRVVYFRGDSQPHVFGNFIARLRAKPDRCHSRFLFWFLKRAYDVGLTERYQKQTTGIRNLETRRFFEIPVPLPSLDEQHRIVGLLDQAAEIRRRADAARSNARAIIPALFLETFGDPGVNPRGWPMTTVRDVLASATYGSSQKANDRAEGVPMIRMGNVTTDGQLDTANLKHVELIGPEREKAELVAGDLLFNRTNSKDLVGKTGLWDGRFDAVAASYFIRLRVNRVVCDPTFLWAFFNSRHMKQVLFETARGAIGQANINGKELRAFRVPLPPLQLQSAFAGHVSQLEAVGRQLDMAALKAEAMADALSAEVFG